MRAALLRNIGDTALEVRDDVELVAVGPGEVKVKIEATGVCHSDLSCMKGVIPQPPPAVLEAEPAEGVDVPVRAGQEVPGAVLGAVRIDDRDEVGILLGVLVEAGHLRRPPGFRF